MLAISASSLGSPLGMLMHWFTVFL